MQNFKDNETVIVARGSKALPKDSQVTILGYDATADTYAVKTDSGQIKTVKAANLAAVPERTFTASEVANALQDLINGGNDRHTIDATARYLGVADRLAYSVEAE